MWWSLVWVGNNPKNPSCWILLALVNQILYRGGQEVSPMCQIFSRKMWAHPAPMFHVIVVGPFTKWGIDFTTCHPTLARGHRYIIVAVDYFTKWVEAMPTFSNDGEMTDAFHF
jgi:hypothetical protein